MKINATDFKRIFIIGVFLLFVVIVVYLLATREVIVIEKESYKITLSQQTNSYDVEFNNTPTKEDLADIDDYFRTLTGREDWENDPRVQFSFFGTMLDVGSPELEKNIEDAEELKRAEQELYDTRVRQQTAPRNGANLPSTPNQADDSDPSRYEGDGQEED